MAQLFLFLPFLFSYSFLLLLGFYLDFLILVFVLVRIMVDLIACAVDLLLFSRVNLCGLCLLVFIVAPVCFSSHPAIFYIEAALSFFLFGFLWTSIICCIAKLPLDLRIMLFYMLASLSSASLGYHHWFSLTKYSSSSKLLGRLLYPSSKHHYGFLRTLVHLVAFVGELHGGDNCVLQLAHGFL